MTYFLELLVLRKKPFFFLLDVSLLAEVAWSTAAWSINAFISFRCPSLICLKSYRITKVGTYIFEFLIFQDLKLISWMSKYNLLRFSMFKNLRLRLEEGHELFKRDEAIAVLVQWDEETVHCLSVTNTKVWHHVLMRVNLLLKVKLLTDYTLNLYNGFVCKNCSFYLHRTHCY